jgi:hydroxymethylglutaryl-CoA synthase
MASLCRRVTRALQVFAVDLVYWALIEPQLYNDFMTTPKDIKFANVPEPDTVLKIGYSASLTDKNVEKTFVGLAKSAFDAHVEPSMHCARRCGNMYTASLYGGLASLVASVEPAELRGKRISMFAYGGGCASSFYTLRVKGDTSDIRSKMDLLARLASMKVVPCQEHVESLKVSPLNAYLHLFFFTHFAVARRKS